MFTAELLPVCIMFACSCSVYSFGHSGSCCCLKRLVLSGCVDVGNATLVRLAIGLDDSGATAQLTARTAPHCTTETTESCCSVPQQQVEELYVEDDSACLCLEYYRTYHKRLDKNCRDDCERQSAVHRAYQESNDPDYNDESERNEYDGFIQHPGYDNNCVPELSLQCVAASTDVALWATDYTATSEQTPADMNQYTLHSRGGKNSNVYPNNTREKIYGNDEGCDKYAKEFCDSVEQLNMKERPAALMRSYACHRQRALEYLDLSGCFQVTDLGIR